MNMKLASIASVLLCWPRSDNVVTATSVISSTTKSSSSYPLWHQYAHPRLENANKIIPFGISTKVTMMSPPVGGEGGKRPHMDGSDGRAELFWIAAHGDETDSGRVINETVYHVAGTYPLDFPPAATSTDGITHLVVRLWGGGGGAGWGGGCAECWWIFDTLDGDKAWGGGGGYVQAMLPITATASSSESSFSDRDASDTSSAGITNTTLTETNLLLIVGGGGKGDNYNDGAPTAGYNGGGGGQVGGGGRTELFVNGNLVLVAGGGGGGSGGWGGPGGEGGGFIAAPVYHGNNSTYEIAGNNATIGNGMDGTDGTGTNSFTDTGGGGGAGYPGGKGGVLDQGCIHAPCPGKGGGGGGAEYAGGIPCSLPAFGGWGEYYQDALGECQGSCITGSKWSGRPLVGTDCGKARLASAKHENCRRVKEEDSDCSHAMEAILSVQWQKHPAEYYEHEENLDEEEKKVLVKQLLPVSLASVLDLVPADIRFQYASGRNHKLLRDSDNIIIGNELNLTLTIVGAFLYSNGDRRYWASQLGTVEGRGSIMKKLHLQIMRYSPMFGIEAPAELSIDFYAVEGQGGPFYQVMEFEDVFVASTTNNEEGDDGTVISDTVKNVLIAVAAIVAMSCCCFGNYYYRRYKALQKKMQEEEFECKPSLSVGKEQVSDNTTPVAKAVALPFYAATANSKTDSDNGTPAAEPEKMGFGKFSFSTSIDIEAYTARPLEELVPVPLPTK